MKYWLYHKVPENMFGETIYPLNTLKKIRPGIFQQAVQKYAGREHLLIRQIPYLDCLWNDVVFMAAVNPIIVNEKFASVGYAQMHFSYFKIDYTTLDKSALLVYTATSYKRGVLENYTEFDSEKMSEYSLFPDYAYEYYLQMWQMGTPRNKIMPYSLIPHILYKGTIDITGTEIVTI